MFKHNCELQGHKFEARYDEVPNKSINYPEIFFTADSKKRELAIVRVYIKDICTHCGKEIKRNPPEQKKETSQPWGQSPPESFLMAARDLSQSMQSLANAIRASSFGQKQYGAGGATGGVG